MKIEVEITEKEEGMKLNFTENLVVLMILVVEDLFQLKIVIISLKLIMYSLLLGLNLMLKTSVI